MTASSQPSFIPQTGAANVRRGAKSGCSLAQSLQTSLKLSVGASSVTVPPSALSFNVITTPSTVPSALSYTPCVHPLDGPASSVLAPRNVLLWFRSDLRLHDNGALAHALDEAGENGNVIPLYTFDTRMFGKTSFGFEKTGRYRAKFLIQSVQTLKSSLQSLSSDLIVRVGDPCMILPQLCKLLNVHSVVTHCEVSLDETRHDEPLQTQLDHIGVDFQTVWGNTLYAKEDLPFDLEDLPDVYAKFRETVQTQCHVRAPLDPPQRLPKLPSRVGVHPRSTCPVGEVPTLKELGLSDPPTATSGGAAGSATAGYSGGEREALDRLAEYVSHCTRSPSPHAISFVDTDFSCKISPWLSLGCVSPRKIYADLGKASAKAAQSTAYYELVWRDFFRFVTAKYSTSGRRASARKSHLSGAIGKSVTGSERKFNRSLVGAGL